MNQPFAPAEHPAALLRRQGLQRLIEALAADGRRVLGPTLLDDAIVYDDIRGIDDLPAGWTALQQPGRYRLQRRDDAALFGYAAAVQSWKRFVHPPRHTLWHMRLAEDGSLSLLDDDEAPQPTAFIGVRPCELRALQLLDRTLLDGPCPDSRYAARRAGCFIVAVHCTDPADTCFCTSMHADGPRAGGGFDLALTELLDAHGHGFVVEVGSEAGARMLERVPHEAADEARLQAARERVRRAAGAMHRSLPGDGLKQLLQDNPEHPRWQQVAERCLACGNCTMVCPTCFCTAVQDHGDLQGSTAWRERAWDSCFTLEFSELHGGSVRAGTSSRYRHWMSHKLAHWFDEFGSSGCVGCGRCITWCPAGIDITEEVAAMRGAAENGHAGA